MIPFKLLKAQNQLLRQQQRTQDQLIRKSLGEMEAVALDATDYIIEHWEKTGRYAEPSLNGMDSVMAAFYHSVLTHAVAAARKQKPRTGKKATKAIINSRRRLSRQNLPYGLPGNLRDLEQIFRDPRYWPRIMKRSKILTSRLQKLYQQKLRRKFNDLMPKILDGQISPAEAKLKIQKEWATSKARVETVFRTETTNYFARTQVAFFAKEEEIIGFLFDSVRDTGRTDICRSRHGLIYKPGSKLLKENTPALHYNCRSHLIPLVNTESNRKMIEDPKRDPTKVSVAPLPPDWRK